jgi:D-alanine-D-alanine ligase
MSRVLVACGGRSLERSISLESGRRAQHALVQLGHDVRLVDVDQTFVDRVRDHAPDFIFVAMHGPGGEDGTVQDILEILGVPYTGSAAPASALCLDKHLFKSTCALNGVPTPDWHSFTRQAFAQYGAARALASVMEQFPGGVVVKPARQGSSLGISVVRDEVALRTAILSAMSYDDRVLLERFVPGREIAVTVIGPAQAPRVLPVAEIDFDEEIYSFAAHYEIGGATVRRAQLEPAVEADIEAIAARAYTASGCRDWARVDIRLDGDDVEVLEINTIPGLTETGPAPLAAEMGGLSFVQFIDAISARAQAG